MRDPGLAFKATTLADAWRLLTGTAGAPAVAAIARAHGDAEAIEMLASENGARSRRVMLDGEWWRGAAQPMLARLADRRRVPRADAPSEGAGWVALVPRAVGGYLMRALDPEDASRILEWRVDAGIAPRLAPFAYTIHAGFPRRALGARDVLRFAFTAGGPELALLALAGLAAALAGLVTPAATGWLIDRAIPAGDGPRIGAMIAALGVAGLGLAAIDILRTLTVLRFEARTGVAMQAALVDRVVSAPAPFFRRFSSGDLALRMASVQTVQRTITGSTLATLLTSVFLLGNLGLMLAYSPALTAAAMGIVLLVVALSVTIGLLRLRIGPRIEALDGRLAALGFETFAGIAKLRAAAAEARAFTRWALRYGEFRDLNGRAATISNAESVALSLLQPAATILVLALAWKVTAEHAAALTTGRFVAFHAAMLALLGGVHAMVSTVLDVANLKPVWDRARPILETAPENAVVRGERHDPAGAIALRGVDFSYPGGPPVLQGIDLEVAPGEFVAIVGPSGSGKSTLLRLLLGFEAPARGDIRYDGRDLATLDLRHLRLRIGTVMQGGRLWAGDLLANIVGATAAGVEEAREAARMAGLAADIEAMPMGLYTMVGEGLSTLSGGQRQRVTLARALVGRPRILLLDEATSALDNVAQAHVLEALETLEATRIVIAHRLSTVRHADRIVVMERGRIVQAGTYEALAASEGPFAAMLARQTA